MTYADYAPLIDTALAVAMALIVWAAYRQLRALRHAPSRSESGGRDRQPQGR